MIELSGIKHCCGKLALLVQQIGSTGWVWGNICQTWVRSAENCTEKKWKGITNEEIREVILRSRPRKCFFFFLESYIKHRREKDLWCKSFWWLTSNVIWKAWVAGLLKTGAKRDTIFNGSSLLHQGWNLIKMASGIELGEIFQPKLEGDHLDTMYLFLNECALVTLSQMVKTEVKNRNRNS